MHAAVKLIECPRDALQGCPRIIPAADKAELIRLLLEAGFRHLDCVSFVSPQAVPQMADSEAVLRKLTPEIEKFARRGEPLELIGIVLNRRGAERGLDTVVTTFGFPFSLSPEFQRRNARQTQEQALAALLEIKSLADESGRKLAVYLSMAFGNPYGDPDSTETMLRALDRLASLGVGEIALADTAGRTATEAIVERYAAARKRFPQLELGLHLHSRPERAIEKIQRAFAAGCRRFDTALGGMGGCPFAGDRLVGNIATEAALQALRAEGIPIHLNPKYLAEAQACMNRLRRQYCEESSTVPAAENDISMNQS